MFGVGCWKLGYKVTRGLLERKCEEAPTRDYTFLQTSSGSRWFRASGHFTADL